MLRAKGEKILYEYDSLDRLIRVNYPQTEDTLYTYGTVSDKVIGGYNKVIKQSDSSGITEYEYGRLGEVTSETKSFNGLGWFDRQQRNLRDYCKDVVNSKEED